MLHIYIYIYIYDISRLSVKMKDAKCGNISGRLRQHLRSSRIHSFIKHVSEVLFYKTTNEIKRMHVKDMRVGMRIISEKCVGGNVVI